MGSDAGLLLAPTRRSAAMVNGWLNGSRLGFDPAFPNPAEPGELRWAITVGDRSEIRTVWVDGPGKHVIDGVEYEALSRTFIPSKLDDNLYLRDTGYRAQINAMPGAASVSTPAWRLHGREGDDPYQVIPTDWLLLAHDRWRRNQDRELPKMLCLGVDVAQGGGDATVLAPLHGVRFEALVREKGRIRRMVHPSL